MRRPRVCMIGLVAVAALGVAGCGSSSEAGTSKSAATSRSSSQGYGETSTTSQASESQSGSAYSYGEEGSATAKTGAAAVVKSKSNKVYGEILAAGPEDHAIYVFAKDRGGTSACSGSCAGVWPPLITSGTPKAQGSVVASKLGTITRSDGKKQVTYAGHPLYYYVADKSAGDVVGEGVVTFGGAWYLLSPAGKVIKKP